MQLALFANPATIRAVDALWGTVKQAAQVVLVLYFVKL
jgi:hypothetical protein